VRVATLNLWALHDAGPREAWADRREVLQAGFRDLRADLVAFQEAILTQGYDQVADVLGPGFHVAHQAEREQDGSGVSIASRWPLGEVHELDQDHTPRTADFACTTLVAEVHAPDPVGRLLMVNHKPYLMVRAGRHGPTLRVTDCARLFDEPVEGV
jgi:hypothetical protein